MEFSFEDLLIKAFESDYYLDFIRDEGFLTAYLNRHHYQRSYQPDQNIFDRLMDVNRMVCFIVPVNVVAVPYYDKSSTNYQEELLPEDHWAWDAADMREAQLNNVPLTTVPDNYLVSLKSHLEKNIAYLSLDLEGDRIVLLKYDPDDRVLIIIVHFKDCLPTDSDSISNYGSSLAESIYGNYEAPTLGLYSYDDAINTLTDHYHLTNNINLVSQIKTQLPSDKAIKVLRRLKQIDDVYHKYPMGLEIVLFPYTEEVSIDNSYIYDL